MPDGAVEALPLSVILFEGRVIVCGLPALATGGNGAGFTVMLTTAEAVLPLLSVMVN